MNLQGIIGDAVAHLGSILPSSWDVLSRPQVQRSAWHTPAAVLSSPRGTGVVRMDGGLDMTLDVNFVISAVDSDDIDEAEFYGLLADGGVVDQLQDAESDYWDEIVMAEWSVDDQMLLGLNLFRGMTVRFALVCPGD
ncbi:MAG: hypothetical protein WKF64_07285 [Ilumatobacteraceae bacterium]